MTKFLLIAATLLLMGCAENHLILNLADPNHEIEPRVWPSPPDTPRYRYVGELTGEDNFKSDNWASPGKAETFFNWLVGLTGFESNPETLLRPQSGMVDEAGSIYVTDIGRAAVYVFNKPEGKLDIWNMADGNTNFVAPIGIAPGARNEVLVADAELHTVFRLDRNGNPVGKFGTDILQRPTGLARDPDRGRIYVADTHAHDIKVFDDDGNLLNTIGHRGEDDGEFNFPTHLAFADDKLYVTDTLNSRIQVFNPDGKMIMKFGERGLFIGNMVRPKGVSVDSHGNIYVVESLYDNLLVFDNQGRTLLGIGGSGSGIGEFYLPSGVWVDSQDQIYIADMYNGRITILQYLGTAQQ